MLSEGINAQVSIPEPNLKTFKTNLTILSILIMFFKIRCRKKQLSFYKLTIKVKEQIVADGLSKEECDLNNIGKKINAVQWNKKMDEGAIVVDMRNHYESEIGHFKGAVYHSLKLLKKSYLKLSVC